MTNIVFTSEPLDFALTVEFDPGAGATTLLGGALRVDAINLKTNAKTAGTATITGATTARCTFGAGLVQPGHYEVQVLATPLGAAPQVVSSELWLVKPGAAA